MSLSMEVTGKCRHLQVLEGAVVITQVTAVVAFCNYNPPLSSTPVTFPSSCNVLRRSSWET